jgi:hypothetical protein
MLMDETFINRTYLVTANVGDGWRSSIVGGDGWGFTVATPEINGYLIGLLSVVPMRR